METNLKLIRNKKFLIFWLAGLVATIGSGMTSFGIGVYIFERTDSAFVKSMISLVAFLPTIVAGPFAGTLADRFDRRKLMVLGDGLSTLGILLILYAIQFANSNVFLIGTGAFLSALFSSIIEPATKATVSDLLSEEDYTRASGLMQLAESARFLIAPVLCAFVMTRGGLTAVLIIDLLTIITTIAAVLVIAKGLVSKESVNKQAYKQSLLQGFEAINKNAGIRVLVVFLILLTFMVGTIQELSTPLILSFTNARTLSMMITIAAFGMVLSSIYLGARELKGRKIIIFSISAFLAGLAMVGFGALENVFVITLSGFLFFATLPFLNSIADYFVRVNIPNILQGRVFGILGTITQLGYLLAYALSGFLSDYAFRPLLSEGGALTDTIGKIIGVGSGRGIGLFIIVEGFVLMLIATLLSKNKALSQLKG
ncbi:MAG TPA: MFS transporter [Anaerolineaceae bacterium]|jgi:DHA3 family macrolide efflux protein-like MFS transporter|nr:MFS transporter [Anaerolineaceae bacterium]